MKKYRLSVREINEYADSIEDKTDVQQKVFDFIDSFDFMRACNTFEYPMVSSDFPYTVEFSISETTGHVVAHVYDYEEHKAWQLAEYQHIQRTLSMTFDEALHDNTPAPEIKEKFVFDVPLTRGFSDTPERDDVCVDSYLDMEYAVNEYFSEKEGKQKIYPWMIRQFACASDFGLEENEFSSLLEECCNG